MGKTFFHTKLIFQRIGIVVLMFTICRILFYAFNSTHFSNVGFSEFLSGLLFDLSAIAMLNSPFITFHILPFPFRDTRWYQKFLKLVFYFTNGLAIALNLMDIEYFKFTFKRSTYDLISMMGMGDDIQQLIPSFLKDYWYLILIFGVMLLIMEWLYRKTQRGKNGAIFSLKYLITHTIIGMIIFGLFLVIYRGGFQLRPINIINASAYTESQNIPLVLNTPFTMIKTVGKKELKEVQYYEDEQTMNAIFNPIKQYNTPPYDSLNAPNVVIIILESFSKEYSGTLNGRKGYMPFIDSLMNEALVFENAYANGKKSIEAVPSILASMPTLMNNPYISSHYSSNKINSIASLLKEKGYTSAFYHGATNGSMGFDAFTNAAGFEHYYGRKEYGNDQHYDGQWGIWDEEMLQYFANGLQQTQEPFVTTFFSLTSHHPFVVPERYNNSFEEGILPIHKSIQYTDYALKKFFEKVATMPWYENTLFVITADHTSSAYRDYYKNIVGRYAVPLIFFHPGNLSLKGQQQTIANQADIMPSVLHYVGYQQPFVAFGSSLFDKHRADQHSISYLNEVYQIINDNYVLQFDGEKSLTLFHHHNDSLLTQNLLNQPEVNRVQKELEYTLKAIIQSYNGRMINNEMTTR